MRVDNPFDRKIESQGDRWPESIRDAAVEINDTLEIAWASVQSVFEAKAKPEHAVAVMQVLLQRADAFRQHTRDELAGRTATAGGRHRRPGQLGDA